MNGNSASRIREEVNPCIRTAIEEFQTEDILIESRGFLHPCYLRGDRWKLFRFWLL